MDSPKISVLIPMYNRKHYIIYAIESVLMQTFQDFEIIVRDDGSTDGSADFVEEKYAAEISSGKLKLRRNEKNIGEFPTDNILLQEATGKYITILHSDDMYLPNALEQMYTTAEKFNADVVHSSVHLTTAPNGAIKTGKPFKIVFYDKQQMKDAVVMSNEPLARFNMWYDDFGIDAQHNIFNRKFLAENDMHFESFGGNRLFALKWIMKSKILVKIPLPIYIYRDSPDSITNAKCPPERVTKLISQQIELSRHLDEFFATDEFFKDNEAFQYRARSHLFLAYDNYWINSRCVYKGGITPELNQAVEDAFKKYFGNDAYLPAFLFHWIHAAIFSQRVDRLTDS